MKILCHTIQAASSILKALKVHGELSVVSLQDLQYLLAMASDLESMASNLLAMASNLEAFFWT